MFKLLFLLMETIEYRVVLIALEFDSSLGYSLRFEISVVLPNSLEKKHWA